jgi:hypothetical protein
MGKATGRRIVNNSNEQCDDPEHTKGDGLPIAEVLDNGRNPGDYS